MFIIAQILTRKRGKFWEYRFQIAKVAGKRQHKSECGYNTKTEALAAGTKALAEYNATGMVFTAAEISVSDYFDYWIENYCKLNLKDSTVNGYKKKIRLYIISEIGKYQLKSITGERLQLLINDLFNSGMSRNTLSVLKGILTSSFGYAVEPLRYILSNPTAYLKLPSYRAKPKTETRTSPHFYINQEDMIKIFKRFPEGSTAFLPLVIAYRCGLRLGETFALSWDNINFENKTLSVEKQIQWQEKDKTNIKSFWYLTNPKYDSNRVISLDDELLEILKNEKQKQTENKQEYAEYYISNYESDHIRRINQNTDGKLVDFVLVEENGNLIKSRIFQHTSKVINKELNIKFTFHSLRHTHCTMLISSGASAKYVQQRLGHMNIKETLQTYQHLTSEMETKGNNVLNSIF